MAETSKPVRYEDLRRELDQTKRSNEGLLDAVERLNGLIERRDREITDLNHLIDVDEIAHLRAANTALTEALADTREALREALAWANISARCYDHVYKRLAALADPPLEEGEPCDAVRSPSSSGETPEPAEVPGRRAVGLPSAATPAPIRKDGASAGSAPLGWRGVYPGMCIDPQLCEGRGFCPRDRACCE